MISGGAIACCCTHPDSDCACPSRIIIKFVINSAKGIFAQCRAGCRPLRGIIAQREDTQVGRAMSELEQTLFSPNGCWTNSRMTCQHPLHPLFLILKPDLPAPPPPPFLILKPVRTYPVQHHGDPKSPHVSILKRRGPGIAKRKDNQDSIIIFSTTFFGLHIFLSRSDQSILLVDKIC